jgi:hypothetical protein
VKSANPGARAENDPRKQAEREKQWVQQQRGEIRNMRVEDSQKMKRDEQTRRLQSGLVAGAVQA